MKINKVINIDVDLVKEIDELREKENRSFTNQIVTIVKEYLKKNK